MNRPLSLKSVLGAVALVSLTAGPAMAHQGDYSDLADRVSPAVVNIFTTKNAPTLRDGPDEERLREFFRRFGLPGMPGGRPGRGGPAEALGSGFILDAEGYVITNNHVVEDTDRVKLRLNDDREFDAVIVGTDEKTDVALLKIESPSGLPFVNLGNSDAVRVGQEVMAVGNPFGLGGTVTTGIVSAKGRSIDGSGHVNYIQTDASINRGNSGGPLFNMSGQVIGMNTAIYSPTGGSVGLGFAVPSNIVARIVDDLKDDGRVERGWLGVRIQPVTDTIASALGLPSVNGALVSGVDASGPSAGTLEPGDVILSFDNRPVLKSRDLPRLVGLTSPSKAVPVRVLRDGVETTLTITLGTLDDGGDGRLRPSAFTPEVKTGRLGAMLDSDDQGRAVVSDLDPNGIAEKSGIRRGDVILSIDGTDVYGPSSVADLISGLSRDAVLMLVRRGEAEIYIGLDLSTS